MSSSSEEDSPLPGRLKVNIFDIDFYNTRPSLLHDKTYSVYRNLKTQTASVIRIFGSTDNGIKLCLHLHQYFPHLSVRLVDLALLCGVITDEHECVDEIPEDVLLTFILDLENEMRSSFKSFNFEGQPDRYDENEHFVYSIERIWMKPVYGYHETLECFIQFNFYSNWMAESAKTTLQKGFMNFRSILVHNHLEYLLQFYVDNQIYLNALYLNGITVRKRKHPNSEQVSEQEEFCSIQMDPQVKDQRLKSIPIRHEYNLLYASSSCFLECDANVSNLVQIVREEHYPKDMFFTPSLPGIVNLWNDHFARAQKRGQDFREVVAFLDNKVERYYSVRNPMNQYLKCLLKAFIKAGKQEDFHALQETFTPGSSCKRSENDAIIQNLEDDLYDPWNSDDEDMNMTQEQLHLQDADYIVEEDDLYDEDGNEGNRSLFDFYIGDEPLMNNSDEQNSGEGEKHFEQPTMIPQLDGDFDDTSGSEQDPRSPFSDVSPISPGTDSAKSPDFGNFTTTELGAEFELLTGQHSTPVQAKVEDDTILKNKRKTPTRRSQRLRSSLKRFRDSFNFDTIEEDNVSSKFRKNADGKREKLTFSFSNQTTNTETLNDFELDSVISCASTNISYDGMTIPIGDLEEELWKECFQLTIMSMELHCRTRDDLLPNPHLDPIKFIMFSVSNEVIKESESSFQLEVNDGDGEGLKFAYIGAIVVDNKQRNIKDIIRIADKQLHITYVKNEAQLLTVFSQYVQKFDPEVLTGYITDTLSWGYLLKRCSVLQFPTLLNSFSRIFSKYHSKNSPGGINKPPKLTGRVILNLWYLMRKELTLRCYTFENVCENLLRERVHKMPNRKLNDLWNSSRKHNDHWSRDQVLQYYLVRVINQVKMIVQTHLVRRTFDLSCLFGMMFSDALTRGTQYRVESMLLPLAKLENFIPVRFTRKIVDEQNAAEEIPMVMEPQIAMHNEPVAVLDFQSLYPSVMIAHNYCFSTCLGKVKNIVRCADTIGCHKLRTEPDVWDRIKDHVDIAPNGSVFVRPNVRKGLLSKMLQDLLYTRILVKNELKEAKSRLSDATLSSQLKRETKILERKLDICQLGLKLIANVTYGYTSANMSGRMPCVDLADAIVSKGRETLERAILFINRWGRTSGTNAKVIYGDTDSVFISFPGSTIEKAFEYSAIIAKEITAQNPFPMMIKVEKVYSPCILFAKKRYCGNAYEGPNKKPFFDAKGIETVRRDNCPAVSKILKRTIEILFESGGDVENLKSYLQWQMTKIVNGRMSNLADFIFAKEFWGLEFYTNITVMPSAIIAKQWIDADPMSVPKTKQRIPYIIVAGGAKDRLADLVRDPKLFLERSNLRINSSYYILRAIFPPLIRALEAIPDFDSSILSKWYEEVRHLKTKKVKIMATEPKGMPGKLVTSDYFTMHICLLCGCKSISKNKLCMSCSSKPQKSVISMFSRLSLADRHLKELEAGCSKCQRKTVARHNNHCVSLDCAKLYTFHQGVRDFDFIAKLNSDLAKEFK